VNSQGLQPAATAAMVTAVIITDILQARLYCMPYLWLLLEAAYL
jgi:hypothetical protein